MKPWRKALILSSAALLLSSILLAALILTEGKQEAPIAENHEILSINVALISALAVNNNSDAYGFIPGDNGVIELVSKPETAGADYSQEMMQSFIYILSRLSSTKAIENYESRGDFGLDEPSATVTFILRDGSRQRLFLGDQSPINGSYYLLKEGEERVYLVGKTIGGLMLRSRTDFWNRRLLPEIGTSSIEALQSIRLRSAELPQRNWEVSHSGDFSFYLTEPLRAALKADQIFSSLILPLSSLYPDTFVSAGEELSLYGLDAPGHILEVRHNGKLHELLFSQDPHGGYYIHKTGSLAVFHAPDDQLQFLTTSYRDLIGDYIYSGSMAALESVHFSRPGRLRDYRITLFGEGPSLYGIMDGTSYRYEEITEALEPLYSIGITGETSGPPELAEEPEAAVTIRKRNGESDIIEFFAKEGKESFVRVNGEVNFLTYSSAADTLEGAFASLKKPGTGE